MDWTSTLGIKTFNRQKKKEGESLKELRIRKITKDCGISKAKC